MENSSNPFWNRISSIGLESNSTKNYSTKKRIILFNQVLFIGVIAVIVQSISLWPFIGVKALFGLIMIATLIASAYLNHIGKFDLAKRLFLYVVYAFGTISTVFIGGSFFYHITAIPVFLFALILVDLKTEKHLIFIGLPCVIGSFLIGQFNLFSAPVFEPSLSLEITKFSNLMSVLALSSIFILFIIRLNAKNEGHLNKAVDELSKKSSAIQSNNEELESIISTRTQELEDKNSILRIQNKENAVLLQEINHRVKNNLQIIISLCNLQLGKIEDEKARAPLQEIQSKIQSISLVHKNLYQKPNYAEIHLNKFIQDLIQNYEGIYSAQRFKFSLNIPNEVKIDALHAIPLGIILNEIITNFHKHCLLKDPERANFSFSLSELEKGQNTLVYMDNGDGFPIDIDREDNGSLGLELIESLTDQIDGEFHYYNDKGAVYAISFPIL